MEKSWGQENAQLVQDGGRRWKLYNQLVILTLMLRHAESKVCVYFDVAPAHCHFDPLCIQLSVSRGVFVSRVAITSDLSWWQLRHGGMRWTFVCVCVCET